MAERKASRGASSTEESLEEEAAAAAVLASVGDTETRNTAAERPH